MEKIMIMSRRSMQLISTFVIMLFLFQFSVPLVQTGISHTPPKCKELFDKWKDSHDKATELNTKLKGLEKDQAWTIVKTALGDATLGGLILGGAAWTIFKESLEHVIKKSIPGGFVVTGIWSLIKSYRSTQAEIDDVTEERDKVNKESAKLWKQYLECMQHDHGSGSVQDDDDNNDGNNDGNSHDAEDSQQQGNVTPTVPDRPGSFELDARKVAILLRWTNSDSDGGSPITDYEYQIQSGNYNRTRWGDWSSWSSAGTGNSTWITGLSAGVNYAVRMRAVNAVGSSSSTGIQIVKTNR